LSFGRHDNGNSGGLKVLARDMARLDKTLGAYGVNRRLGCRNSLIWQDFSHQGESQL
jgi:hypothetical protein